ncbi:MAG: hypothetical protein QXT20_03405 [Candidatus Woesearchaeota archaeon]
MPKSIEEIEAEVKKRLASGQGQQSEFVSSQFSSFAREEQEEAALPTFFEKYADFAGKLLSFIDIKDESQPEMYEDIQIARLHIRPKQVLAAAILTVLLGIMSALPLIILGWIDLAFFFIFTGMFLAYIAYTYPAFSSQITKIRAQQESLLALLYITIYMRVNPVLENAIAFATEHLNGPLGRDFKRILWLLDGGKISSIHDGFKLYMELWLKRNPDFVKSFMILLSVTTQPDKEHQSAILDKALSTLLQDTYEKMKYYAHDLKNPIMIINTFGLMLPLIGLIAFPIISVFMSSSIKISYLFFGYIVILPSLIYFFSNRILAKRPGAFSAPDISGNPNLPPKGKYRLLVRKKSYLVPVLPVAILAALLIMSPGLFHLFTATIPVFLEASKLPANASPPPALAHEYEPSVMFMTLTIPVGIAVGIFLFYYGRSVQKIKLRDEIIEIEEDLNASLYSIANQFTENIPVEIAVENFVNNYQVMNLKKRQIFHLFNRILEKMRTLGLTFGQAVFHPQEGIIKEYPSTLLKEIMWIFTESARKGSQVIYNIMQKIAVYLDNVKKIKELIYDLLEETVTSVRMQAKFLAPFIAGIVGSLTLVIIKSLYDMLGRLELVMQKLAGSALGSQDTGFFTEFINFTRVTPPPIFQVLVGIYTIEAVFLLSQLANGVENGFDEISRDAEIAKNVLIAIIVYVFVTVIGSTFLKMLVASGISATG